MFGFEQLKVWQKSIEFADDIYAATRLFPDEERYGLCVQMRRSAVSISSNIAEGSSRGSHRDFSRFLEIAYGSLMEGVSQSTVAKRQTFLAPSTYQSHYDKAEELARMLSGLRATLRIDDHP